jgi:hypothetical protein
MALRGRPVKLTALAGRRDDDDSADADADADADVDERVGDVDVWGLRERSKDKKP